MKETIIVCVGVILGFFLSIIKDKINRKNATKSLKTVIIYELKEIKKDIEENMKGFPDMDSPHNILELMNDLQRASISDKTYECPIIDSNYNKIGELGHQSVSAIVRTKNIISKINRTWREFEKVALKNQRDWITNNCMSLIGTTQELEKQVNTTLKILKKP